MNSVTFSTDDYVVPEWSHQPRFAYHLEVIKDGSIIGNINIKKKAFVLVGRVNDLCDLFIDNQSISRKHAILQFKEGEDCPYLYDLGGTHGTQVNRQKLPKRAYQKVKPFDMIKFGISSRYYILRCPELEHLEKQNQDQAENKFQQILAERKKQLSKQDLKQKYLQLLQNDPYFKANNLSKKLQGADPNRSVNGVDWGISDQYEVYSYRNQNQFQLEPDVIRRLPGLDQNQLNKISDFQSHLRKYEEIEGELNQLANKERRQFGLEDKLRDKKQKLQKRFVQAVEALQKSEDWIKVNIFGEKQARVARKERAEKQDDTFQNDQFLDRTIKQKRQAKTQQIPKQKQSTQIFTTQDFWKLEKQLRSQLQNLIKLEKQIKQSNGAGEGQKQEQEEDDLDAFMKENNQNLQQEQLTLSNQRLIESHRKIKQIKDYLEPLVGSAEIKKIENEERGITTVRYETSQEKKNRKDKQTKRKIEETLHKLDVIKQMEEDIDEEDVRIFDYYKNLEIRQEQNQDDEDKQYKQRQRPVHYEQQAHEYEQPKRKLYPASQQWSRDQTEKQQDEQCFDLTKLK